MTEHGSRAPGGRSPAGAAAAGAAVVLALAVGACADAPTRPAEEPAANVAAAAPAGAPPEAAPGGLLAGESRRLLPSLADGRARLELRGYVDALAAALDAGDAGRARRQLALARKLIASRLESAEGADLAALALTLDQVEAELDRAAAAAAPARP